VDFVEKIMPVVTSSQGKTWTGPSLYKNPNLVSNVPLVFVRMVLS
jgi:hypothetical protein